METRLAIESESVEQCIDSQHGEQTAIEACFPCLHQREQIDDRLAIRGKQRLRAAHAILSAKAIDLLFVRVESPAAA